jgi:hypothetical protein
LGVPHDHVCCSGLQQPKQQTLWDQPFGQPQAQYPQPPALPLMLQLPLTLVLVLLRLVQQVPC